MKCPVSVSLVFLQVTARQVKRGMVRSKVKKRSWLVFDNVDFKSQHRAAAFPMLQSSLKQWRFSNQLQGVLMSPQVRFLMFNVTFVTLAMSQSFVNSHSVRVLHQIPVCCNVMMTTMTILDPNLSVFSERFLSECSCLERKAIDIALRPS